MLITVHLRSKFEEIAEHLGKLSDRTVVSLGQHEGGQRSDVGFYMFKPVPVAHVELLT